MFVLAATISSIICCGIILLTEGTLSFDKPNCFIKQLVLLYAQTFTQENEHCDWMILDHVPLII